MPISNVTVEAKFKKIKYDVIEGNNLEYILNGNEEATFRINADYSLLDKVFVDDKLLSTDNYTSKSGSTIITLNKDYLNTLSEGEHSLKTTFTDGGESEVQFRITKEENKNIKDMLQTYEENPKTSDNIIMYSIIFLISFLGTITGYCLEKWKYKTEK